MNNFIVLQVRLNSRRLPRKLLYELRGKTIFEHILIRLLQAKLPSGVIVATTEDTLPHIKGITDRYPIEVIIGPEDDVLKRYALAVEKYEIDNVIRATGDNPLVSIEYIDKTLELHLKSGADLTTYIGLPYGTGVEAVKGEAILKAGNEAVDPFEREHITQYIYRNKDLFKVVKAEPEDKLKRPDLRLTVDTIDDYRMMEKIYKNLWKDRPISLIDVIDFLDKKTM